MKNSFLETIRSFDGKVFNLLYHQKRYESVLKSFGVTEYKNLQDYLNPPENGLSRCRVVYTIDTISLSYHSYEKRDIHSLHLIHDNTIEYTKKSTDRQKLDELYALREQCDDVLIVKNGLITDTSIANIAFLKDDVWYTPASPLLCGTTRQRLLDNGVLVTKDIKVEELKSFSKVALLNAMIDFDIISDITYKY